MLSFKYQNYARWVFFIYVIAITVISVSGTSTTVSTGADKIDHAGAFVLFALLFSFAFLASRPWHTFLWGLAYGIFIEFIQHFLPYRTADFWDVVADVIGLAIGLLALNLYTRLKKNPESL